MRIIKKLASYEGVHTVGINEENTISSGQSHGLKDGDNVRFYIPRLYKYIADGTMTEVGHPGLGRFKMDAR